MDKQFLYMQKLAGLITESQYKKLLEDMSIVDRILDKILSQGEDSLTSEEREYLDKYSKNEKNIPQPSSFTTVYVSVPYVELYKIENFPAIYNAKDISFKCKDTEEDTCKNYPEMVELLKNKSFELILDKINKHENSLNSKPMYFHGIEFMGNFSSPLDLAYAQVSGDGFLYIVDSLSRFNDHFDGNNYINFKIEDDWGVKSWKKL
jgi:hypothetical protein